MFRNRSKPPAPPTASQDVIILPVDKEQEIRQLIAAGRKIEAVKRVREFTNAGLKSAKDYVDALARDLR